MNGLTKTFATFVVVFHFAVFIVEVFFWMQPSIHEFALTRVAEPAAVEPLVQATILRTLFVNQGFYNLFLSIAGGAGLALSSRGRKEAGEALVACACLSALGAGLVLAATTKAYLGAAMQGLPGAIAIAAMFWRGAAKPDRAEGRS